MSKRLVTMSGRDGIWLSTGQETAQLHESIIIGGAKNMVNLEEAYLTPSPSAAYIITNLQSYVKLRKLEVFQMNPKLHIWDVKATPLTSLR
jgi:hypothetical protein